MKQALFATIMIAALSAVSCATAAKRVEVPIGRTVAVVTSDNPTPYFRWALRVRYLEDGREWTPQSCQQAVEELRVMIPHEFLSALGDIISAYSKNKPVDLKNNGDVSALKEHIDAALSSRFLGEDGFLDAVQAKIQRSWAKKDRSGVESSCQFIFGDIDQIWFSVIFSAAIKE